MESKVFADLLGRYTIEAGLMLVSAWIVYKLGVLFLNKHFEHIKQVSDEHNARVDKIIKAHEEERVHWNIKNNDMISKFTEAVEHLRQEFTHIANWKSEVFNFFDKREGRK